MVKVLYLVNGLGFSENMPIGGADKRVSEVGKQIILNGGTVSVLTTEEGARLLLDDGLKTQFYVTAEPSWWHKSWHRSTFGRSFSYIYLTLVSFLTVGSNNSFDYIYSSSDYFFDLIPCLLLKLKFRKCKLIGISHHHIDVPWKRKGSLVINTLVFLSQRLDFMLLKFFDLVFVPKNFEGGLIKNVLTQYGISGNSIKGFQNGVNASFIDSVIVEDKEYSACFIGGFRPSKGITDLVPIWKKVLEKQKGAKILLIGGGSIEYENKIKEILSKEKLAENIILAGVVPQSEIFRKIKSCKIFVSPSYEEGWGIAVLEALACKIPAVVYDLPAYEVFSDAIIKVPLGDTNSMASNIANLLENNFEYEKRVNLGYEIAKAYDWSKVVRSEIEILESYGKVK